MSEKRWFVMRDLSRRNAYVMAFHQLLKAGLEVFTPMTQMIMTIGGKRQRRDVPVIQDLLFVNDTKESLDPFVENLPNLQYRFVKGGMQNAPMTVPSDDMERFIRAVSQSDSILFYKPGEITKSMYGKKVRIVGGPLDTFEGRLLSVRGMRRRRLIIDLPNLITAAVEVAPEFISIAN